MKSTSPSRQKNKKRRKSPNSSEIQSVPIASAKGAVCGSVCFILLSLICSVVCLFSDNPDGLISPSALITDIISFFACGFFACKKGKGAIQCGLLSGGIMTTICFILSLCISKEHSSFSSFPVSLLMRLSMIAISLFGALLAMNTGSRHRRKK